MIMKQLVRYTSVIIGGWATLAVVLALVLTNVLVRVSRPVTDGSVNAVLLTPTPSIRSSFREKMVRSGSVYAPDGCHVAYMEWPAAAVGEEVEAVIYGSGETMKCGFEDQVLWKGRVPFPNVGDASRLLGWSGDGMKLAAGVGDTILVFQFTRSEKVWRTETGEVRADYLKIGEMKEKDTQGKQTGAVFFADKGAGILFTSGSDLYRLEPQVEEIVVGEADEHIYGFFPVSFGGYAYWVQLTPEGTASDSGKYTYSIGVVSEGGEKRYAVPETTGSIDYPGKILVSPNGRSACVVAGTAGYKGYLVFGLAGGETYATGRQHSDCVRWLDGTNVVVREQPYAEPSLVQYYLLNTQTRQKQFLAAQDSFEEK